MSLSSKSSTSHTFETQRGRRLDRSYRSLMAFVADDMRARPKAFDGDDDGFPVPVSTQHARYKSFLRSWMHRRSWWIGNGFSNSWISTSSVMMSVWTKHERNTKRTVDPSLAVSTDLLVQSGDTVKRRTAGFLCDGRKRTDRPTHQQRNGKARRSDNAAGKKTRPSKTNTQTYTREPPRAALPSLPLLTLCCCQ